MYTRRLNFGDQVDMAVLPTHLANCLRGVEARAVKIEANRVRFRGGVFRVVSNWNVLCPFGFGDLTVHTNLHQVEYRLSVRELVLVGTTMTLSLTAFMLIESRSWHILAAIPFFWLWLVGANLAIGFNRFKSFLQHAIETAPRPQQ